MSDEQTSTQGAAKQQTQPPAPPAVERHGADYWRERARFTFHVSPHALAGAFHGQDAEDYSEEDVRALLDKFSDTEGT